MQTAGKHNLKAVSSIPETYMQSFDEQQQHVCDAEGAAERLLNRRLCKGMGTHPLYPSVRDGVAEVEAVCGCG